MLSLEQILSGNGRWIVILVVILLTFFFERAFSKALEVFFNRKTDLSQYRFVRHFSSAIIYLFGTGVVIFLIPQFRSLSVSLFAGAGVLAVVAGFASQQALSHVVSGIFIAVFKPFRVGDLIKLKDNLVGVVEDITLRHTVIKNFENKRIIVPNNTMTNEIIENANLEDDKTCRYVEIGISYDSDIDKAMKIMTDEAKKHPLFLDTRSAAEKKQKVHPVTVRVIGFGDSSVNLRAWVWAATPIDAFKLGTDLNKSIKKRFDKAGVEIPFPYRTIVFKDKKRKMGKR